MGSLLISHGARDSCSLEDLAACAGCFNPDSPFVRDPSTFGVHHPRSYFLRSWLTSECGDHRELRRVARDNQEKERPPRPYWEAGIGDMLALLLDSVVAFADSEDERARRCTTVARRGRALAGAAGGA
jgi:hypothetical protein